MKSSPEVLVVGVSHHTAPVEVRERLAFDKKTIPDCLKQIMDDGTVSEGVLVSTCNRVEFYGVGPDASAALQKVRGYLQQRSGEHDVSNYLYTRHGAEAVEHTFRVTSSLDSMVVGEPQILGQVKDAYALAEESGTIGTLLSRCFSRAFSVAKRVRTETQIASGTVSVSSVAVELAQKIFGHLEGRRVLLVGAGEMSEAAAKSLSGAGSILHVVNRSPERAEALATECGGVARPYDALTSEMAAADVVITSTASPVPIITPELMQDVIRARKRRPIFLIDIAVPRDIDAKVGSMENVFLYDVDDLSKVAAENLAARKKEAELAEQLVLGEAELFEKWRKSLDLTPTIVGLRQRFREVARAELDRTLPRLQSLSDKERRTLEAMTEAMVNKLLHGPLMQLKRTTDGNEAAGLIDATRQLFALDELEPPPVKAKKSKKSTAESTEHEEAPMDSSQANKPTELVGELATAGGRGGKS